MANNFSCQNCHAVVDWHTREVVQPHKQLEYKTIGGKYCDALECIKVEAVDTYGVANDETISNIRERHRTELDRSEIR